MPAGRGGPDRSHSQITNSQVTGSPAPVSAGAVGDQSAAVEPPIDVEALSEGLSYPAPPCARRLTHVAISLCDSKIGPEHRHRLFGQIRALLLSQQPHDASPQFLTVRHQFAVRVQDNDYADQDSGPQQPCRSRNAGIYYSPHRLVPPRKTPTLPPRLPIPDTLRSSAMQPDQRGQTWR